MLVRHLPPADRERLHTFARCFRDFRENGMFLTCRCTPYRGCNNLSHWSIPCCMRSTCRKHTGDNCGVALRAPARGEGGSGAESSPVVQGGWLAASWLQQLQDPHAVHRECSTATYTLQLPSSQ